MEITIFAKRRTSKDGKTFFNYLTTLTKKDGTTQTMRVAFRDTGSNPSPKPESCPRNIEFDIKQANIATRTFADPNTGEQKISYTLWISEWKDGTPYVDHSFDEYV